MPSLEKQNLKFTVGAVKNFTINGITADNKTSIDEFRPLQKLKIYKAVAQRNAEFSFKTAVMIQNTSTAKTGKIKISDIRWRFILFNQDAAAGTEDKVYYLSGDKLTEIPISMKFNAAEILSSDNTDSSINKVLNLFSNKKMTGNALLQFSVELSVQDQRKEVVQVFPLFEKNVR